MGELQDDFFGHRILFLVDKVQVRAQVVEVVAIRMYEQAVFGAGHAHVEPAYLLGVFGMFVGYEHVHVVEFPAFGFVDG